MSGKRPMLTNLARSKVNIQIRQRVLFNLYKSYEKIYEKYDDAADRAAESAQEDETRIHTEASTHTYANIAANTITALRKRKSPDLSQSTDQVEGKDEPRKRRKLQNLYQQSLPLILSKKKLELLDYPRLTASNTKCDEKVKNFKVGYCDRCKVEFEIKELKSLTREEEEACKYHVGKLEQKFVQMEKIRKYTCCDLPAGSSGCTSGPHVYSISEFLAMTEVFTFRQIMGVEDEVHEIILGIDCEMAYTTRGLEVIRVTVVDVDRNILFDSHVETVGSIVDFNSRWSGITRESYDKAGKKSLEEIQDLLFEEMKSQDAILVGHSLDSDLKALRILHLNVVDTCDIYKHPKGLPIKYSLKALAKMHLKKFIQDSATGHDSAEDATTAIDLLLHYLQCHSNDAKEKCDILIVSKEDENELEDIKYE